MRITNNMLISSMVGYLSTNLASMAKYQAMAGTGKLIQKASEDPVVAARTLKLNTDISVLAQYRKNADSAIAWMETTETVLRTLEIQLMDIRTRMVQASNSGTLADEDRQAIASQVKQLREEIISLANSTYAGRYIFSGYKSDTPLLDSNGFFNTVVSQLEKIHYEVGVTNKLQVNVTGDSLFNLGQVVGYLPARSSLVQDVDDALAMLDARATVTSSAPLSLNSPGVFDMTGVGVDIDLGAGPPRTVLFDEANVNYVNRMTGEQIIDFINKRLGLDGTASIDKNGNIVIRSHVGAMGAPADAAGAAAGSADALFGGSYAISGSMINGSKSLTAPTLDVSSFAQFSIVVDRSSDPIYINLSTSSPPSVIRDLANARQDEIAAEINRQIADAVTGAPPGANMLWAKCTVEDGRFCLTSESFGFQSYIEIAGGQEIYDLFGVTPSHKQGNIEQQGRLVGSRDFREPVVDITQFRNALTGEAPTIRVVIDGVFIANIQLDDGDPAVDPCNMTLRQIMKKIDDQLGMHGSCDISSDGKLIIRTAQGGQGSSVELASIDEAFFEFLFGTDPIVKNGANDPTHGYYRSGVPYSATDTVALPPGFEMNVLINSTTDSPVSIAIGGFAVGMGIMDIVDHINQACMADPVLSQLVLPSESNAFSFASLVNSNGEQLYPPQPGQAVPDGDAAMFLRIQSHTWGTGSNIKIENTPAQPATDFAAGMAELFGKGTINAPVVMGGVDGIEQEICLWLDVADGQPGNLNR
ncbi:MAG: flagellar hook-associated protein FlgL, partial [Oscillospiraceae bacterium]|nr:flagellar hook-associated protein FlgL [Oscillospiraceae bacterium]